MYESKIKYKIKPIFISVNSLCQKSNPDPSLKLKQKLVQTNPVFLVWSVIRRPVESVRSTNTLVHDVYLLNFTNALNSTSRLYGKMGCTEYGKGKVLVSVCTGVYVSACVQMPVKVKWNRITRFILLILCVFTSRRIMGNWDMGLYIREIVGIA